MNPHPPYINPPCPAKYTHKPTTDTSSQISDNSENSDWSKYDEKTNIDGPHLIQQIKYKDSSSQINCDSDNTNIVNCDIQRIDKVLSLQRINDNNDSLRVDKISSTETNTCDIIVDKLSSMEGLQQLQLVQRSEVMLRVNATMSDAASQTEREELRTPLPMRRKLQEEIECEKLSKDLVSYLSPSDRLKGILGKFKYINNIKILLYC